MAQDLAGIALLLRHRAEQFRPPFSTHAIIENCFPEVLVTGSATHELAAMTSNGPLILYRRGLSTPEQRIAIMHALAHHMFDGAMAACRPSLKDAESERRCDAFALEMLLPVRDLLAYMTRRPSEDPVHQEIYLDGVDGIASRFAVPSSCVDQRIREVVALDKFVKHCA